MFFKPVFKNLQGWGFHNLLKSSIYFFFILARRKPLPTDSRCHLCYRVISLLVESTGCLSQNYWTVWLEWTLKGRLVQPICNEQGHLQLDQVARSPVQSDLEWFQGWGTEHISRQPVPVFQQPGWKNFYVLSCLNLPSFSLKPLHFLSLLQRKWKIVSYCSI